MSYDEEPWWTKSPTAADAEDELNCCGTCLKWTLFLFGLIAIGSAVVLAVPHSNVVGASLKDQSLGNNLTGTVNVIFNPFWEMKYGLTLSSGVSCSQTKTVGCDTKYISCDKYDIFVWLAGGYAVFFLASMILICCEKFCFVLITLGVTLGCVGVSVGLLWNTSNDFKDEVKDFAGMESFVCAMVKESNQCIQTMAADCLNIGGGKIEFNGFKLPDVVGGENVTYYAEWGLWVFTAGVACTFLFILFYFALLCGCCTKSKEHGTSAV